MMLPFNEHRPIESPALAPAQHRFVQTDGPELAVGLINNMPDGALKATEHRFRRLIEASAGRIRIRFYCFALPSIRRSRAARSHIQLEYADIADLDRLHIDGLIVTGAEPSAATLPEEPFWRELTDIVDWAKTRTRSTIWSCLAAHAAVLHLDGIERQSLRTKCSGVYDCTRTTDDCLTRGLPSSLKVSHSRYNEVREGDLSAHGYQILTRSDVAGVDIFARQMESRFVFFQGHPEYDGLSLQREYMRDLARFLGRERNDYPAVPADYFDAITEARLASFERRARAERDPTLAAELPGLTLRPDTPSGAAARLIFRNWLDFLGQSAKAALPAR